MTRRRLRPDELELWNSVARSAKPLENKGRLVKPQKQVSPAKPNMPKPAAIAPFTVGEKHPSRNETHLPPESWSERLTRAPVHMDSKAFGKLKRGKLKPEARLDLHGMTLDQAHPVLLRFILSAHGNGLRLVLVITGKGDRDDPYSHAPVRRGVLKQQVPHWLRSAPLGSVVLQVSEAHIRHGGGGAYYVYLRKSR